MSSAAQQGLGRAVQIEAARVLQLLKPVRLHNHRRRVGRTQIRRVAFSVQRAPHTSQHGRWNFQRLVSHFVAGKHSFPGKYVPLISMAW